MNTDVIYALSAQAKGKIERPYRWLRLEGVRTQQTCQEGRFNGVTAT
jgi:hypothetical protein